MTVLDQLLDLVPLAVARALTDEARNVLRFPAGPPPSVVDGPLAHDAGGVPDAGAQRVVVLLGPGATLVGVADTLLPLYAGPNPPTADELARALYVYNQAYLPAGAGQVGLVLPLPIEVNAGTGAWTVNAAKVRAWAGQFPGAARSTLRAAVRPLPVPDAATLDADAAGTVAAQPPGMLGPQLWTRALRNPFEAVLPFLAALRALDAPGALATTLAALGEATPGQAALLAMNWAGGGILRALSRILAAAPAGTDTAQLAAARTLLDTALHAQPAPPDLPETVGQRAERQGRSQPTEGAATDPVGGIHRVVLGRDVAVGRAVPLRTGGTTTAGPAFAGRVPLRPYLTADAAHLDPAGDTRIAASLTILAGQAPDLAGLDAVQAGGPGRLTAGIGRWTAGPPGELADVLYGYKLLSPDEFTLFFKLAGLDVDQDPGDATRHRLLRVDPTGATTVLDAAALQAFLGGTAGPGGSVTYSSDWAARFRLPALVSSWYRRAQVAHAAAGIAATATPIELLAATVGPFPDRPYTLPLDAAPRGDLQVALTGLLGAPDNPTSVLGQVKAAGSQAAGTFAAALVDLTSGPAAATYAGYFDEETYYIGSMAKVAPLYVAHELRHRAQKLINAVKAANLNTGDHWVQDVRNAMHKIWGRQVCAGFPGLATAFPGRASRWDTILTISPTGDVSFTTNGATVEQMAAVGEFGQPATGMKYREWLWITIHFSNNNTAGLLIDALQYPYLNGVLARGGFFDAATGKGIWVSGDYISHDWAHGDYLTLTPRGQQHYQAKTNFVGNCKQFARLLTLAVTHQLFDADSTTCDDMLAFMLKRTVAGENRSFIGESLDSVDFVRSKIGIGDPPKTPPLHLGGICDCAVIDRHVGGSPIRYVAVITGGYVSGPEIDAFHKVADDALDSAVLVVQP